MADPQSPFEQRRELEAHLAAITPFAANWPAKTWTAGERVTAGMMNGVRDQLNELHTTMGGLDPTNVAYKNQANTFTLPQTFSDAVYIRTASNPSLYIYDAAQPTNLRMFRIMNQSQTLRFYAQDDGESGFVTTMAVDRVGKLMIGPRLQIGNTSGFRGDVPALRNTGARLDVVLGDETNWATIQSLNVYTVATGNSLGDLTCRGATNFMNGVIVSASYLQVQNDSIYIDRGYLYPGAVTGEAAQRSWYLGSHSSYGLYTNTGLYVVGNVWCAAVVARATMDVSGMTYCRAGLRVGLDPANGTGIDCWFIESQNHIRAQAGLYDYGRGNPIGTWTWVDPAAYVHGQLTGVSGSMGWSIVGKTMHIVFSIAGTFYATGGNLVNMTIPGGMLPATNFHIPITISHAAQQWHFGFAAFSTSQYYLSFFDAQLFNFPPSSAMYFYGSMTLAVQ